MNWSRWPNFTEAEFACSCGCSHADMEPRFLDALQMLRTSYGYPMVVTSGFRCPKHNTTIGGHPRSAHMRGLAGDFQVYGERLRALLLLIGSTFHGLGIAQKAELSARFVHLDMADPPGRVWSY